MLEMPSDLDRPWEPWTPKVGDRVRIRLNGECAQNWPHDYAYGGNCPGVRRIGHDEREHDRTGTIRITDMPVQSHPYLVKLDAPFIWECWRMEHVSCAAIELEPLEDDRA